MRSRWFTLEFGLYFCVIVWFYLYQVPTSALRLRQVCEEHGSCPYFLRPSWYGFIDGGDIQWREFRGALHLLAPAAAALVLLRRILGRRRDWCCMGLSLAFVGYVHGAHALFHIAACMGAYGIAKLLGSSRWLPYAAWAYGLGLMVFKEAGASHVSFELLLGPMGQWLDDLPRAYDWHQSLSLVVLRLISFSMDYHWALLGAPEAKAAAEDCKVEPSASYKARERSSRPLHEYSLVRCLAHAMYPPLWLAGPTITFNAFASFLDRPQESYPWRRLALYAARLLFALGLLEFALHFVPVFAMGRSRAYLELIGPGKPADVAAMFVYLTLNVMWLKFLVIWRFARLWALCDGVECVENMQRCINNNFSIIGFWKGWHVSFNRWLVRYLYIPLGGRRWRALNVWVVFGFVALWHDAEVKLVAWGMLNSAFVALEHGAAALWNTKLFGPVRAQPELARHICALSGAAYVLIMMFVNLVGYGVGLSGSTQITSDAFFDSASGARTLLGSWLTMIAGVQVMMELRETGICRRDAGEDKAT